MTWRGLVRVSPEEIRRHVESSTAIEIGSKNAKRAMEGYGPQFDNPQKFPDGMHYCGSGPSLQETYEKQRLLIKRLFDLGNRMFGLLCVSPEIPSDLPLLDEWEKIRMTQPMYLGGSLGRDRENSDALD